MVLNAVLTPGSYYVDPWPPPVPSMDLAQRVSSFSLVLHLHVCASTVLYCTEVHVCIGTYVRVM